MENSGCSNNPLNPHSIVSQSYLKKNYKETTQAIYKKLTSASMTTASIMSTIYDFTTLKEFNFRIK